MRNIIILIHGTWGKSENAWYQESKHENSFRFRLLEKLENDGLEGGVIVPFEWSGENNHKERISASERLSNNLVKLFQIHNHNVAFHFIAHSHGGNIVLKTIEMYLAKLKNLLTEERVFLTDDLPDLFKRSIKLDKTFELIAGTTFKKDNCYYHKNIIKQTMDVVTKYNIESDSLVANKDKKLKKLLLNIEKAHRLHFEKIALSPNLKLKYEEEKEITKQFNLEDNFINSIDRLLTYREFNKIYSISTLGTPFYFKSWKIPKSSKFFDKLISIMVVSFPFLLLYVLTVVYYTFVFIIKTTDVPFTWASYFNIMNWDSSVIISYFIGGTIMATSYIINLPIRSPSNTNIYFDVTKLNNFIKNLADRKISKILVIHANHLDEAFLGLSSLPIVGSFARKKFKNINKPKLWNFKKPHKIIGTQETSLHQIIRYYISYFTSLGKSIFGIFTYPIHFILFNPIINWVITHKLFSTIRSLLIGLPESEFSQSNIDIRNKFGGFPNSHETISSQNQDIDKYFEVDSRNVYDYIKVIKINNDIESERYSFLRKKGIELEPYIKRSMIGKEQLIDFSTLTDEEIWNILSLEERGKEFFGIAGLRHSMYYEQKEIVDMIGHHIIKESK